MKTCPFCQETLTGKATNEHIVPKWLLNELQINDKEIHPTHISNTGEKVSTRTHQLKNLVAGGICSDCNNGWMSQLESSSQNIIQDLITNKSSITDYSMSERFTLARWATKTAFALNIGSNFHKNIPKHFYHQIYTLSSTLPDRIVVFAQTHEYTDDFFWIQGSTWGVEDQYSNRIPEEEIDLLISNSFKIALQIRGLLLLIAFNPIETFFYSMWRGIHVPLWPESLPVGYYEQDDFPWSDSQDATVSFHLGLELIRKPPIS